MITIPVIDISPFEAGSPGAGAVVDAVRAACEEHGFFVVAGHGIAPDVNEDLDRACRAFFSRPLQEKSAFTPEDGERKRGWWGVGAMATARSLGLDSPPDFMEYLGFNPSLDARVQCVPTCLAPGEPPGDPVTSGEWIARKTYATT